MRPTNRRRTGALALSPESLVGAGVKISVGTPFGMIDSARFHATDAYFAAGSLTAMARWKNGKIVGAQSLRANVNDLASLSAYAWNVATCGVLRVIQIDQYDSDGCDGSWM